MRLRAALFAVLLVLAPGPGAAEESVRRLVFDVVHEDYGNIGSFEQTIRREDSGRIEVDGRFEVAVDILGLTLFRRVSERREVWEDGRLVKFSAETDDDGTTLTVSGQANGPGFRVEGPDGTGEAPANVWPTDPFSSAVRGAGALLGAERGALFEVELVEESEGAAPGDPTGAPVRRIVLAGDRPRTLWFDAAGYLLAMRFSARGDTLELRRRP